MTDAVITLAQALRERRKALGLTQAAFARRAGIPERTYLRIEAGDQNVKIGTYAQAAQELGLALTLASHTRPTLDQLDDLYGDS